MKKKSLFGLLTVMTVLVFLFSACGGTGTVLLPITIEEIEGNWNLELSLVEGADARNNDELYGAFEIELNDIEKWKGYFEKYTSEYTGWAQDVEYFKETLPEKHINLFFKVTEQEFIQACDDLIEIANTVSEAEVFLGLLEILALVDDAHTNIYGFGNYQSDYYPFEIRKIGNEHYVFSACQGYEAYLGAKLTSINEYTIEQIRNKTEKIIPAENDVMIAYRTPEYLNSPEALEYCGIVGGGFKTRNECHNHWRTVQ